MTKYLRLQYSLPLLACCSHWHIGQFSGNFGTSYKRYSLPVSGIV